MFKSLIVTDIDWQDTHIFQGGASTYFRWSGLLFRYEVVPFCNCIISSFNLVGSL